MSWKVIFRPPALREIREASNWYAAQRPALKAEFLDRVEQALLDLSRNPRLRSPKLEGRDVRWLRPSRFPYRIIYELRASEQAIVIVAVLHSSRDDDHWKRRLK